MDSLLKTQLCMIVSKPTCQTLQFYLWKIPIVFRLGVENRIAQEAILINLCASGPLAQSVEQQTFNLWVVGSIPTGPTFSS